ncbi:EAL domain-containing protein [Gallaecimonas sp. GXIMD4217]|uniref:EAL domain-containing protein n=1 Tax=Gallaecimonas sp. GXIMD4217 TaxID=3131927 RepID=UPI00311B14EA
MNNKDVARQHPFAAPLCLAMLYFGLASLCIALSRQPGSVATVWLPNAVAVAIFFRLPFSQWPALGLVLIGANLAANLAFGDGAFFATQLALANLAEVLVGAWLLKRFLAPSQLLEDLKGWVQCLLLGGLVAPLVGALAGSSVLAFNGLASVRDALGLWFVGDSLGMMALLPLALLTTEQRLKALFEGKGAAETLLTWLLVMLVVYLAFTQMPFPFVFVAAPLVWAALRLPFYGGLWVIFSGAVLISALVALEAIDLRQIYPGMTPSLLLSPVLLCLLPAYVTAMTTAASRREKELLAQSESRFRQAMDNSAIGMALVSLEGQWLKVNKSLCDFLGYSEREFAKLTFQDITHPDDLNADLELVGEVLAGNIDNYRMEKRYLRKDGQVVWALLAVSLVRDSEGQPRYFVSQVEDIHRRKMAETRLETFEKRWKFALYGSGLGAYDWDLDSGKAYYSDWTQELLGLTDAELGCREDWLDRVHGDDRERLQVQLHAHLAGRTGQLHLEYRIRDARGSYRWVLDRGQIMEREPDGRPSRLIGTLVDITDIKRTQLDNERLTQRVTLATRAGGVGIWEYDLVTQTLAWDKRMYQLYGQLPSDQKLPYELWRESLHPDDMERAEAEVELALADVKAFDTEFRVVWPNGEVRHIRALASFEYDGDGNKIRMIGTNWDITDQKHLTEALHEEKERLHITLYSIGDAVICTDKDLKITFMNPVAEDMTGWPMALALGHHVDSVFHITKGRDGPPMPSPVAQCLERNQTVFLGEGAVLHSRDGSLFDVQDSAAPVKTLAGEVMGAVLVFQDVTESQEMLRQLSHSASHDALTGLPNRTAFERELREMAKLSAEHGRRHALTFIDLDRFKVVNDSAGHAAGDALLKEIGSCLQSQVRASDMAARLGGDEFGLLLRDCELDKAREITEQLVRRIEAIQFRWDDRVYDVGASAGLTSIHQDNSLMADIMSQADVACYAAKHAGRGRVMLYEPQQSLAVEQHKEIFMAAGIREALDEGRFELHAQPVAATDNLASTHHLEMLVRLHDKDGQLVMPGAFIPAAERYGMMVHIDKWVVREVLQRQAKAIAEAGIKVAINICADALGDHQFQSFLSQMVSQSPIPAHHICFEITETAMINHMGQASECVSTLRSMGCKVALDDFGSGLSSFNYLKRFRVDYLKVDGSFIEQLCESPVDQVIVESIHQVAHKLGAMTIAEYVQDDATVRLLARMGVELVQGFGVARPEPLAELLARHRDAKVVALKRV